MTQQYELTYISLEETLPGVEQGIQAVGGVISSNRSFGRRQFAYPIKKETAGYYTTLRLSMEPAAAQELERRFRLLPGLLRYLLVTIPAMTATTDLEVDSSIVEAKELKSETHEDSAAPTVSEEERSKKLDQELSKLLGADAPASESEADAPESNAAASDQKE